MNCGRAGAADLGVFRRKAESGVAYQTGGITMKGTDGSDMTHLAPRPRLGFSVEMQFYFRLTYGRCPIRLARTPYIPQKVRHGGRAVKLGRAKRQAANRPHVVLELTGGSTLDRPVTGIMHTRRALVDDQRVVGFEQFDRHSCFAVSR